MITDILQRRGTDRRDGVRRREATPALVGAKKLDLRKCQRAVIEDIGSGGMRIRTGAPLKAGSKVFIYDRNGKPLYPVRVMWGRCDAKKIGQGFVSGCKLLSPVERGGSGISLVVSGPVNLGRILFFALVLGVLVAAVFFVFPFLNLL